MVDLVNSLLKQCPTVPPTLVDAHLRRMPENYLEGYSPTEIARHLRLLARLCAEQPIEVEVRPLGGRDYEICVVGFDRTGVLAAITTALASNGFDTQDLRLATYQSDPDDADERARFVDVARVAAKDRCNVADMAKDLRERLRIAFQHLAEGDFIERPDGGGRQSLDRERRGPPREACRHSLGCQRGVAAGRFSIGEQARHRRHERSLPGHAGQPGSQSGGKDRFVSFGRLRPDARALPERGHGPGIVHVSSDRSSAGFRNGRRGQRIDAALAGHGVPAQRRPGDLGSPLRSAHERHGSSLAVRSRCWVCIMRISTASCIAI